MQFILIIVNIAIAVISGMAVYDFTQSYLWAVVGAFFLGGAASANPIFAFLALPAVQYFFGNGLTWHTYTVWGLNLFVFAFVILASSKSRFN